MSDLVRTFPPEVHDSLAELRRIAKAAKSKDDPLLRRCTADELALAEQRHKPWQCTDHNSRTGLPCQRAKLRGLSVCRRHGGNITRVQRKLRRRLAEEAPELLESMLAHTKNAEQPAVAFKANQDLLDRFGFGALVQAKVRASKRQDSAGVSVNVQIGFLG